MLRYLAWIELPRSITPEVAGLTVGAFVGVVGFILVMLLVGRGQRRPSRRMAASADQVVFIPPYGAMQRDTPLPPQAFEVPVPHRFHPSTELSARAFARMGHDEVDDEPLALAPAMPAVTVAPVVMLSAPEKPTGETSADKSAPHPLGIIKSGSPAMRAAPISDLTFDDSPTEIGETYFDEPPQPRRRSDPPKIRPVPPAGPRFPQETPSRG